MMKPSRYARLIGVIYVVGAAFGLIIGLGGLMVLWGTRAAVVSDVSEAADLFGRSLTATHDTIAVLDQTFLEASTDLDLAQKMLKDVSGTLTSSQTMINRTGELVGGQMVDFINNTRTSLASVQTSANVVDNMLRTITGIPLIGPWLGGQRYNPPVPLGDSVANVKKSMDPLPDTLDKIRTDLNTSATNVATIKSEIDSLSKQVDSVRQSLTEARRVVDEYRGVLDNLQTRYQHFQAGLPLTLTLIYLGLTLLLIWILITQTGLLIHGLMLLEAGRERTDTGE